VNPAAVRLRADQSPARRPRGSLRSASAEADATRSRLLLSPGPACMHGVVSARMAARDGLSACARRVAELRRTQPPPQAPARSHAAVDAARAVRSTSGPPLARDRPTQSYLTIAADRPAGPVQIDVRYSDGQALHQTKPRPHARSRCMY
jgi:hypothetical protein